MEARPAQALAHGTGEEHPGVSVVIPAFNYAHYLPSAIDSALGQTYRPLEVMVVDDGSTDDTREVVAAYGERVRYLHQPNAGLSAARNTGLQAAGHPFVAFLDADDAWLPEMVERAMATFQRLPPQFGLVACQSLAIDASGARLGLGKGILDTEGEFTAADILLRTRFSPSTVIARRAAFDECGVFDTTLRSSEDRDMWIRMAHRWRIYLNRDRLALIRRHANNMSRHADRMKLNMGKVIKKSWQNRVAPRHRVAFWLQVLAIFYYQTALIYQGQGCRGAALRDILVSLVVWPLPLSSRRIHAAVSAVRLRTLVRLCVGEKRRQEPATA